MTPNPPTPGPLAIDPILHDVDGWGLYVHIPFCARKCPYCDFTVAVLTHRPETAYIDALWQEFDARRAAYHGPLRSVYLGGGTPGLLLPASVQHFGEKLRERGLLQNLEEFSVEFNPEHANRERLQAWVEAGATRISMGVQALHRHALQTLGREHQPEDVFEAIARAKDAGFRHISIDFIFAVPDVSPAQTLKDIQQAVQIPGVDHVSLYELTVEDRTVFGVKRRQGRLPELPDEQVLLHWRALSDILESHGFARYEVSNFAQPEAHARHNASYWTGRPYLGLGVGAASLSWQAEERHTRPQAITRRTNRAQLKGYLQDPLSGAELETLPWDDHLGELLCLAIRTQAGIELPAMELRFQLAMPAVAEQLARWVQQGLAEREGASVRMRRDALEIADSLALDILNALDKDLSSLA